MRGWGQSLAVLRQRDFGLLLGGQAISVLGDRMAVVALPFAVLELGGSAAAVGLVFAARSAAMVACLLLGGVLGDRFSRRGVMVAADLVRLLTQGALAVWLLGGAPPLWVLAGGAALTGAATGVFSPPSTALLTELLPARDLQAGNALRSVARSVGEVGGPVLAGVLAATAGPGWAIGADAATFGVSAALLVRLRLPAALAREPDGTSYLADLRAGWSAFAARRWLWTSVSAIAAFNLTWAAWSAIGPVVAQEDLGGAAAWGGVLSVLGVGAFAGSLLAVRIEPARPLLVFAISGIASAVPLAMLALGAPLAVVLVAAAVDGAALMIGNTIWETTMQRHVPPDVLARVSAYDWVGSLALYPVGLAIWGPVAALVGEQTALWLAFSGQCATMLALLAVRDVRRLPALPP